MIKLELTQSEFEALCILAYENPCPSSCCIEENQYIDIECDECEFKQSQWSLWEKIERVK